MKRLNLTEGEKRKIREKQQSKNLSGWGTRVWNTEYLNKSPLKEGYVTRLNESDVADKMMECQKSNVGNFTPEDEKQFGILFNSIFTNLVLGLMNNVDINATVIARFFIGDVFGSMVFVIWLMIMFNMLKDRRFYPVHDD